MLPVALRFSRWRVSPASSARRPRRTIYFVCFGSEESGGYGSLLHCKLDSAVTQIVLNINFEMLGRPDPARRNAVADGFRAPDLNHPLAKQARCWLQTRIRSRNSSNAPTITHSHCAVSSLIRSRVMVCIPTITGPVTTSARSTFMTRRSTRWWRRFAGWPIRISDQHGCRKAPTR